MLLKGTRGNVRLFLFARAAKVSSSARAGAARASALCPSTRMLKVWYCRTGAVLCSCRSVAGGECSPTHSPRRGGGQAPRPEHPRARALPCTPPLRIWVALFPISVFECSLVENRNIRVRVRRTREVLSVPSAQKISLVTSAWKGGRCHASVRFPLQGHRSHESHRNQS